MFYAFLIILAIAVGAYLCFLLRMVIKNQKDTIAAIKSQTQSVILQDNSLQTLKLQVAALEESILELSIRSINVKTKLKNFVHNCMKEGNSRTTIEEASKSMGISKSKTKRILLILVELRIASIVGEDIDFRIKKEQLSIALEKIDMFFNDEMR
ncbi:MAG: hypothetical protein MJZ25_14325 [Fibrobacter sp.]|nr:hypothetical protein [Fibrobacter sp.]